jgi:hypothetical protein
VRINLDSGQVTDGGGGAPSATAAIGTPEVRLVIQRALKGDLPRSRDLKYWEPEGLTMKHINCIFRKALGFTNAEIAAEFGMTDSYVSIVLNHPDSETILSTIAGAMGDRITDPLERAKATAGEAFGEIVSIMRTSKNDTVRRKSALDILSLAGYGQAKKVDVAVTHMLPAAAAARLSDTLEASRRVADVPYTQYRTVPTPQSQLGDGSGEVPAPAQRPESGEQCLGQPPAEDSPLEDVRRIA